MQAPWWWSKPETRRSDIYVYFNVKFNMFFKLIKAHLLVSEIYIVIFIEINKHHCIKLHFVLMCFTAGDFLEIPMFACFGMRFSLSYCWVKEILALQLSIFFIVFWSLPMLLAWEPITNVMLYITLCFAIQRINLKKTFLEFRGCNLLCCLHSLLNAKLHFRQRLVKTIVMFSHTSSRSPWNISMGPPRDPWNSG